MRESSSVQTDEVQSVSQGYMGKINCIIGSLLQCLSNNCVISVAVEQKCGIESESCSGIECYLPKTGYLAIPLKCKLDTQWYEYYKTPKQTFSSPPNWKLEIRIHRHHHCPLTVSGYIFLHNTGGHPVLID
ncbi:hypothetical protein AMECASPLE_003162 [Ameca splendens]|uniref:Uncharacterized protein n=1 Tax=Ameca splendens TaxID=208324 RepID=A0ABV1A583_9TELE